MPKIAHIIGEGPELAESQRRVLDLLQSHPDHLFRMHNDDLQDIKAWLTKPDAPEPPKGLLMHRFGERDYSVGTIRWALSTLRSRGKIDSIKIHRRTYYGSHDAIRSAQEAMH